MADRLLGDQAYVAEHDPLTDQVVLVGRVPGPAGSFELALVGVHVVLDAAEPDLVNALHIDRAGDAQLVRLLLGDASAASALKLFTSAAVAQDVVAQDVVRTHIHAEPTRRGRRRGVVPDVARLAVAIAADRAPGLSDDERALALLEAAVLTHQLGLDPWMPGWSQVLHSAAATVARAGRLDGRASTRAAAVCRDAAELLDDDLLRTRLSRLAGSVEQWPAAGGARPMAAAAPAMARKVAAEADAMVSFLPRALDRSVVVDSLPMLIADVVPAIARTTNDEYEVRIDGWAGRTTGWWVRVFDRDRVPRAVVPMVAGGGDAVARFVVGATDAAAMVVDIVDDPTAALDGDAVAAFRAGIAAGKRAARLERTGRDSAAAAAWTSASRLHAAAGDSWRSRTAAARASGDFFGSDRDDIVRLDPVIADLVAPF